MRNKLLLAASLTFAVFCSPPVGAQNTSAPTRENAQTINTKTINVRAAAHDGFDRVVFDWPQNVGYTLTRNGNQAFVTFDSDATIKFSRDVQAYVTRGRSFTARRDNGHVVVSFAISPDAILKDFISNKSVVIDISGKAAPVDAPAPPPASNDTVAAVPVTPKPTPDDSQNKTKDAATAPPQSLTLPPASTPVIAARTQTAAPKGQQAVPAPPASSTTPTTPAAPVISPPAVAPSSVQSPPTAVPAAAVPKKMTASTLALDDTPTLVASLDPHVATRAAIFQRANIGYIIFDRKLTLTPAALQNGVPAQIDLQPLDMVKNSGYRFAVPPNSDLQATLNKTMWKIFLGKKTGAAPVTTSLVAQPDFALGARILLPLPDAPDPITFTDPVVGDTLILIPLAQSQAFNTQRNLSDLTILPAAQGLVIKPLIDKITVRAVSDGIEITTDGGLTLSRAVDTGAAQQSAAKSRAQAAGKSMFDFATWDSKSGESFTQTRQRLQQTIVDVPEAERNRARLELARFYFANGYGEEALSLLNYLSKEVPDLRAHADFIGMVGASEILAYRSDEGLRDLSLPILADQPETELWQAVGLAQLREWKEAEEKFAVRESLLTGYPEPFFSRFFVLAIESAIAVDKTHEASDWLDFVSNAPHQDAINPALSYLRGALHAKAGRADAAEQAWKETAASNDRLYKVRAELALIDLGVSTGSLTPAQAADRLEALRFGWRGDDLEVDILHRLGQFYIQSKNVKAGLNAMSQAITLYPASPMVSQIHSEMETIFHNVFLGDLGKKLSPLDSLTLYQQYRDLMPSGKEGDAVMNNLAERLIAIDLLEQASSLLQDLAKNRLQGIEKDRIALRLAAIRLLDHKPEDALPALDITSGDALPEAMQNERILLRARALSEMHRDAEAASLLKDNPSQGAKLLRADIAMHGQQWGDAAKALMELAGPPPASGRVLKTEQAEWILNAAIAYALESDQTNLDKLAIDYSAAMATTPQNDTFRLLTEPEKSGQLRDLSAAQSQISQVDMFQGFLNSYRNGPAGNAPTPPATKP